MTDPLAAVFQDTDAASITSHEEDFDIPCESGQCPEEGRDYSHPAHYLVSMTCSCILYWCLDRMKLYITEDVIEGTYCPDHDDHDVYLKHSIPIRKV